MINDILFLMTAPIVIVNLLMILSITFGSESSLTLYIFGQVILKLLIVKPKQR
jgi:hypothetical protein